MRTEDRRRNGLLVELVLRHAQGTPLHLFRELAREPGLRVRGLAAGRQQAAMAAANDCAMPFADLQFNEVAPLAQIDTKGNKVEATSESDAESPAGDGKLQAKGSFKVAPGTKVVALVTVPGKKAANVRFAVK